VLKGGTIGQPNGSGAPLRCGQTAVGRIDADESCAGRTFGPQARPASTARQVYEYIAGSQVQVAEHLLRFGQGQESDVRETPG
jgi:hypothetical protein